MAKWYGITLTNEDFHIAEVSSRKFSKEIVQMAVKEFLEKESAGEMEGKFLNGTGKVKYIIGMARKNCGLFNVHKKAAIPIIYGDPYESAELPRMRFNLDKEEAMLERIASGDVGDYKLEE